MVPLVVILSVLLLPVSDCKARIGTAGAWVSRVRFNCLTRLKFPASSVCLTNTDLLPSVLKVKIGLVPVQVTVEFQVIPSCEYSKKAFVSIPVTVTIPTEVIRSELLKPVSWSKVKRGATGIAVSIVIEGAKLAAVLLLPTASVNLFAFTLITPSVVLAALGVKVAVYTKP